MCMRFAACMSIHHVHAVHYVTFGRRHGGKPWASGSSRLTPGLVCPRHARQMERIFINAECFGEVLLRAGCALQSEIHPSFIKEIFMGCLLGKQRGAGSWGEVEDSPAAPQRLPVGSCSGLAAARGGG